MIIDLTDLMMGNSSEVYVDDQVSIPSDYYIHTSIRKLDSVFFKGSIDRLSDTDYQIVGVISGNMIVPDDVTLEDVVENFHVEIDESFSENDSLEYLKIVQNKLDITDFLWQNILVEVPSKVKKKGNENLTLKGDGWRLVTEDELNKGDNSPFSELSKIFDSRKE